MNEYTAPNGKPLKYPFDEVAAGNPFTFDEADLQKVRSAACHWAKRHGMKFSVKKWGGAWQCWRSDNG